MLLAGLSLAAAIAGCTASAPLTIDLTASKDVLTPDVRGDRLDLTYRVSRPSTLSVSIVSRSGSCVCAEVGRAAPTKRDLRLSIRRGGT